MSGFQDLAVRLSELLEIPESQALAFVDKAIPVFVVESIIGLPTTRVRGLVGIHCLGYDSQPAVAAQVSHVQLLNPPGSGVTVHVDRVIITSAGSSSANLRRFDTALTNLSTNKGFADFRERGDPVSEVRIQTVAPVLGTLLGELGTTAASGKILDLKSLIMDPGQGVLIAHNNVNNEIRAFWFWREV